MFVFYNNSLSAFANIKLSPISIIIISILGNPRAFANSYTKYFRFWQDELILNYLVKEISVEKGGRKTFGRHKSHYELVVFVEALGKVV